MNKITKFALTIPAILAVVGGVALTQVAAQSTAPGSTATPQAPRTQQGQPGQFGPDQGGPGGRGGHGGPGGRGGPGGVVTSVSDTSVSITDQRQQPVTATLSANTTVIQFTTQMTGTLADIKVGGNIKIDGRPTGAGALDAQRVVILPAGDRAGGPVSAVKDSTITVDAHHTAVTITTNSATQFYVNGKLGAITDVTAGKFVDAFGAKQTDGSVVATTVVVNDRPVGGPQDRGGRGHGRGGPMDQGQGFQPGTNNATPNTTPVPNNTVAPGNA